MSGLLETYAAAALGLASVAMHLPARAASLSLALGTGASPATDPTLSALDRLAQALNQARDRLFSAFAEMTATTGMSALVGGLRESALVADRTLRVHGLAIRLVARYRLHATAAPVLPATLHDRLLDQLHTWGADDVRSTVVELRGGLLKVAQILSTRGDLLPAAYAEALGPLQDQVPPCAFHIVEHALRRELGDRLEDFDWVDPQPLAAASIAQVHRARLWDGRDVVVKVQYPRTRETFAADLTAFTRGAWLLDRAFPPSQQAPLAEELARHIAREANFLREAAAATRMREAIEDSDLDGVRVPAIIPQYSSASVLTMEHIAGERLTDALAKLQCCGNQAAIDEIVTRIVRTYCFQILRLGFFQADPHPGNFLVEPDGTVALLDFGCCKELPADRRAAYMGLGAAIALGHEPTIRHWFREAGFEVVDERAWAKLLGIARRITRSVSGGAMRWPTPDEIIEDIGANLGIHPPYDFALLARVFVTLGGLIRQYAPGLNLFTVIAPYVILGAVGSAPSARS